MVREGERHGQKQNEMISGGFNTHASNEEVMDRFGVLERNPEGQILVEFIERIEGSRSEPLWPAVLHAGSMEVRRFWFGSVDREGQRKDLTGC